jgi:uncharacterized membrane protein
MTGAGTGDSGLSPATLVALAYAGGWTTGALVWLIERENHQVRFHAAQAVLLFGTLTALWIALWAGSFAVLTISVAGFTALQRLSYAVVVGAVLLWVFALWKSWQGEPWRAPVFGHYAQRLSAWRAS